MALRRRILFPLPLAVALVAAAPASAGSQRIAGIAFATNDQAYAWFRDGAVTVGTARHFEKYATARAYQLPAGETTSAIVAMAIASNNQVYTWYRDGRTSTGTATDLAQYSGLRTFTLPPGRTTADIVGIAIAQGDAVYTWYANGTYTIGTATDLDAHQAPQAFTLPSSQTPGDIVEIDVAKATNHVHAWYRNGYGSAGTAADLDSSIGAFAYIPSQVLHRWWGPGAITSPLPPGIVSGPEIGEHEDEDAVVPPPPPPPPGGETGSGEGLADLSPEPTALFGSGLSGAKDPMIAVGEQYIISSTTGALVFLDRDGHQLPVTNGVPTKITTAEFFAGLVAPTLPDGSFNENNVNLYMELPRPCDSTAYPQLRSGNRFCIASFYDTRVSYDPTSKRFFVMSNARHDLWPKDCGNGDKCSCFVVRLSTVSDPGVCDEITGTSCSISSDAYCGQARRYLAFAVSKTSDPRDGFHQYILTESNPRDFPWQSVNGNHYVLSHKSEATQEDPVATVFAVNALKAGVEHPPYFRYYRSDVAGVTSVLPVAQYQTQAGATFLMGVTGTTLYAFAFPQTSDPWTAPPLKASSVQLAEGVRRQGAAFRHGYLYVVGSVAAETQGDATRYEVRVFRVPLSWNGTLLKASTDQALGYRQITFGRRGYLDPPGARYSYEYPAITVNADDVVVVGYVRRPFSGPMSSPEARISVWRPGDPQFCNSRRTHEGEGVDSAPDPDYTAAVADPNGTSLWVATPYVNANDLWVTAIARVDP